MKPRLFNPRAAALVAAAVAAPAAHAALDHRRHPGRRVPRPDGRQRRVHPDQEHLHHPADHRRLGDLGLQRAGTAIGSRATVPVGVTLPAGKSYLFTNVQPGRRGHRRLVLGHRPGRPIFTTGIADTGGVQLRNADGTVIDAVGHTSVVRDLPRGHRPGVPDRERQRRLHPQGARRTPTTTPTTSPARRRRSRRTAARTARPSAPRAARRPGRHDADHETSRRSARSPRATAPA